MYSFLAKAAISFLVLLVFGLARRYAPVAADSRSLPPIEELESKFSVTQWRFAAAMLGAGFLLFVSIHQTLVIANRYWAEQDGPAQFVLYPQDAIWWILPIFAAISLSWDLTLWAWSLLGSKQTASEYEYWSNSKAGFDATKILRIMAAVIGLPIAVLTALALPMHDSLQDSAIRSRGYGLHSARIFKYSDAKDLAVIDGFRTRDGHLTRRAGCVLYFADGSKWSSAETGDFRKSVDPQLLLFLERKTGLRAIHAATEEELRPEN